MFYAIPASYSESSQIEGKEQIHMIYECMIYFDSVRKNMILQGIFSELFMCLVGRSLCLSRPQSYGAWWEEFPLAGIVQSVVPMSMAETNLLPQILF